MQQVWESVEASESVLDALIPIGNGKRSFAYPCYETWVGQGETRLSYVPLVATEFGFMSEDDKGAHIPCIGDEVWGKRLVNYFTKHNVSWTVWCFHWSWTPSLIERDYSPREGQGVFFKDVMSNKIAFFEEAKSAVQAKSE